MSLIAAANICTQGAVSCSDQAWLNTGDNAWQLTAATFVALMSVPGLAVLFGGLVQKKWVVNTMLMTFAGFASVLIVWVLWAFKMGFGAPILHGANWKASSDPISNFFANFVGHPGTTLSAAGLESQASIPLVNPGMPTFALPSASVVYFQFVFAAITPLLFLGSVLSRIKFKVWIVFVPLWTSCVYAVNCMLLWGGGYWAQQGAADFSGGYVIHLAAGVSGFVAAACIGPRIRADREKALPHSLPLVAIGGGIVWLGWNGFNGGDPYFASADAAAAVINTNMATAAALAVLEQLVSLLELGQQVGEGHLARFHRLHDRLVRLDVPVARQLHEESRRRHGHYLHTRHRRLFRGLTARYLRGPERRRLPKRRWFAGCSQGPAVRPPEVIAHPVLSGHHDHPLGRDGDLHNLAGNQGINALAFAQDVGCRLRDR